MYKKRLICSNFINLKLTERSSRMSEQSSSNILDQFTHDLPFFYCVLKHDGSIIDHNDQWKQSVRANQKQNANGNIFDFIMLEDLPDLALILEQVFTQKTTRYITRLKPLGTNPSIVIEWTAKVKNALIYQIGYDITDHYILEQKYTAKNQFHNTVLDIAGVGHWKYHMTERKLHASNNALELFGFSRNSSPELKDLINILKSDDRMAIIVAIKELLEKQIPFSLDLTIGENENKARFGNITGRVILDLQQKPIYIYGTTQDITNRKSSEIKLLEKNEEIELQAIELRKLNNKLLALNKQYANSKSQFDEKENNYREIFNGSNDAVFIHDAKTFEIVDVNNTMVQMYGFSSKEEALGVGFEYLSAKNDSFNLENAFVLLKKVYETNFPETFEWLAKKKNGDNFWIEVSLKRIIINGLPRVMASVRDISQRKTVQEDLRKSQDRLNSLLSNMEEVAWSHKMPGNILVYMSPSSEKILGFTPERFMQEPDLWKEIIHPEDVDNVLDVLLNYKPKTYFEIEYRVILPSGEVKWVKDRTKVTYDNCGEPTRIDGIVSDITAKKEAELKYSEVELRYRELIDLSVDGIAIGTADGYILEANQQFLNIIGETQENVTKRHISSFFDQEEVERNPLRFDLLHKGEVVIRERKIKANNGMQIFVEMRSKRMPNNTLQLVVRDISERKKAEKEIAYRVELQNLVISLGTRFFNIRPKDLDDAVNQSLMEIGQFTQVDRAYIFAYEKTNKYQSNTYEWCADGIEAKISENQNIPVSISLKAYNKHLNGKAYYFKHIDEIKDDQEFYQKLMDQDVKSLVTIPMVYNQKCYGFVGFDSVKSTRLWKDEEIAILQLFADLLVNFKVKSQFEIKLREAKHFAETSEKKVRGLVDMSPIGILNVTPDGSIIDLNDAAVTILGSPSKEFTKSLNLYKVKQLEEIGFIDDLKYCIAEKTIVNNEMQYRSVWGKDVYTRYYLVPIIIDDEFKSILINIEDITEIEIARRNLITLKEKAEESDRLKSAFLANMSHEIRTPMNGIIGFAELLAEESIPDINKQQYIGIITKNAYHLLDLINDIIDISKIEAGQANINVNAVNLNTLLSDVYVFLEPNSEKKGISFFYSTSLSDAHSLIITDPVKLKQILINLVNNAIKFTELGEVQFGYNIENDYVVFYVKDTGCGIPADSIATVFERFSQLDNQPKESRTGTGLGLAISKAYSELLGGKIWLTSEQDKGTQFYFTIPYKPVSAKGNEPTTLQRNFDWPTKTILVVEDDYSNRIFVTEVLRKSNVNVVSVTNGKEALDIILSGRKVDLILMDIKMPNMDGLETTIEILKVNNQIPIIAQTAYAFAEDIAKASEAGCVDFIAKPMKAGELLAIVEKHLFKPVHN